MTTRTENPMAALSVVGGRLALDFTNTTSRIDEERVSEWLHAYPDLVWWGLHVGLLDESRAGAMLSLADREPEEAARVFSRALALRGAMYRLFSAASDGGTPAPDDVETVNAELGRAMAHLRVVPEGEGYGWGWEEGTALDRVLWPVARDAAELLVGPDLARVGGCCGDDCTWLYLDTSRNRSRRWCDMKDCGNRAKARRHYHRARKAGG